MYFNYKNTFNCWANSQIQTFFITIFFWLVVWNSILIKSSISCHCPFLSIRYWTIYGSHVGQFLYVVNKVCFAFSIWYSLVMQKGQLIANRIMFGILVLKLMHLGSLLLSIKKRLRVARKCFPGGTVKRSQGTFIRIFPSQLKQPGNQREIMPRRSKRFILFLA